MDKDLSKIIEQIIDLVMPELTPYEISLYLFLLRHSFLKNNTLTIRIGKRTIADKFVRGVRGDRVNFNHISRVLKELEKKGCIKVGDVDRAGTLYEIILPENIRFVAEKLAIGETEEEVDYFTNSKERKKLFERDKWICHYCGEKVNEKNATLDHLTPQSKGGKNTKDNLKTCCWVCNSIKSGKTYEEAAPFLLKSIRERKTKSQG